MKNNLLKYLLLLNGILSILAGCLSYPTIPTTSIPKTKPIILTSASEGMIPLNPSLSQLSITTTVTLDEECPRGATWHLFALTVTPSGGSETVMAEFSIECDTFSLYSYTDWYGSGSSISEEFFTKESRTANIFVSLDTESQMVFVEASSTESWKTKSYAKIIEPKGRRILPSKGVQNFDETTKLYLCSKDGAPSALSCTASRLQLNSVFRENSLSLGAFTPVSQAFYPLIDGKLTSIINSEDSAYFGDQASSPTAGSSPSWDSSNSFVQITSETQFLTLPIPSVTEDSMNIPTITFAFWIRVTSILQASTTLFSLISADETPGLSFVVSQEDLEISALFKGNPIMMSTLPLTLNTWQLITCSLYFPPGDASVPLTLSVGDSKTMVTTSSPAPTKLQIGGSTASFIGDISSVQILSPGASYLTDTDTCSPNNAIEINSGPYAISCVEGSSFNPYNNKCYSPCSTDPVTPFTDAPYTLCFSDGSSSGSITAEESGGLSGGAIAGIAIGSMAGVALLGAIGYFAELKFTKNKAKKAAAKAYQIQMSSPATETIPKTTADMVSP